ncbi:unnamed protein product [Brassica oleracea]
MAPSTSVADPQPSSTTDSFNSNAAAENDIRPFFVLHKASSGSKPTATVKAKRRIESPSPKLAKKSEIESVEEEDGQFFSTLRLKVFETVWSKIENTIQDVLRDSNSKVFSGVHNWICESFESVRSSGALSLSEAVRSYPVLSQPSSKQLFTALVLTRNLEMVDDLSTFEDLGLHLKSQGCHVAKLSSMDFSAKNGVGGCLRGLLRQFVMPTIDVADVTVLASWYRENGNHKNPVVIIVDDTERCSGSVLSDLILILSEWAVKVPIFLIMGVSTAHDAPRKILSANALQRLCASRFTLSSPAERMDAVLEAVFLKPCSGFTVSHKVALFMRSYFLCQDGTLTSFVKTLKIACLQHFSLEPLSIMLEHFCQDNQLPGEGTGLLTEATMKHAFDLPSVTRNKITRSTCEMLPQFLLDLQRMPNPWSIVVLCIYEAGKFDKLRLLDIFCETLDPEARYLKYFAPSAILNSQSHVSGRNSVIRRVLRKLRDLSPAQLSSLLKSWESLTAEFSEINEKVMELHPFMRNVEAAGQRPGLPTSPKKHASRSHSKLEKELKAMTDKISAVIEFMLREYMKPVETVPFNEILCFKNVDKLQSALLGDPRGRIQSDLLESHSILNCLCCSQRGTTLLPSMHDTSILYTLAQEHADVINLHDWYQSFKTILIPRNSKAKSKSKTTSKSKKRKERYEEPEPPAEASIQARFCRAVMELQIAGLIRMPSKRRPDFVQREVVSNLGQNGVMVILDNHLTTPGWCCSDNDLDAFFEYPNFDPAVWAKGLSKMASLFRNVTNVVGMSLRNEPRGTRDYPNLWFKYMPKGGEAVHAANPDVLVILSGIDYDTNLSFLRDRFFNVSFTDKLVFEQHWYSFSDGRDSWVKHNSNDFCAKIIEKVTHNGGFLIGRGFPLFLTEFGANLRSGDVSGNRYMNCLVAWAAENDLDWAVWALTGDYYLRTGQKHMVETFGVLAPNWKDVANSTYLQKLSGIQLPVRGPGLQSKKLLFHPTTGLCVTSNLSNNSPTLRLEQCRKAEPSTFNPSEGILWSNKLCVEAPNAVGQKVKLGAGTKCSKLGQTSATHMHLSFKTTSNDSFLCFDVDERDNSIVANPCKCLTMDASCDPASQWFKVL